MVDIPIKFLSDKAPEYDRKWKKTKVPAKNKFGKEIFKNLKII